MPAKKNPIKTWEQKFIQVLSEIAGKYGLEIVTSSGYYDRSLNLVRTNVYFQPEDKLVNLMTVELEMSDGNAAVILKPNHTDSYEAEKRYTLTSITNGEYFQEIVDEIDRQFNENFLQRSRQNKKAEPIDLSKLEVYPEFRF